MHTTHTLIVILLTFVSHVLAHGYLKSVTIDGTIYEGNIPNQTPRDSPIRLINNVDPVKGTSNPNLSCGQGAQNAALVVPANAGSQVAFSWASGGGGNWPHNTGPLMTYMALCDVTTCDKYNASNAKWFKIAEAGQNSNGSGWVQAELMHGQSYSVTLPIDLAPGEYLIRHEIIALQIALAIGGAEFYPSCTQVRVSSNNDGTPSPTVSFPGAYSNVDPGILTPDVYEPGFVYVFPGPPIATFSPASGDNAASNSGVPSSTAILPSASASVSLSVSASASSVSVISATLTSQSALPTTQIFTPASASAPSSTSTDNVGSCRPRNMNGNQPRDKFQPRRRLVKSRRSRLH